MTIGTIALAVFLLLYALSAFGLGIPPVVLAITAIIAAVLLLVAGGIPVGGPRA